MSKEDSSVERFFGAHAADYSKSPSHAHGDDLAALLKSLDPRPTDLALDVATGTGFTAVALAPLVNHVTGIDVTDGMLAEARKLAQTEGTSNAGFEHGDALHMKFADSSFDIVTTRRAAHHFQDVPRFLSEAKRVLRPGGRLGVVDMSPPEGAEGFSNEIEKLRDSSHVEAFTPTAWRGMVTGAGFAIRSVQLLGERISFDKWLYPVAIGSDEEKSIRLAWDKASPAAKQILQAQVNGTIRGWTKSRIVLVATRG